MFEKCGLRDIFCGFVRMKWLILAAVILFTCIGSLLYYSGLQAYKAQSKPASADREVYAGYAYYYLSGKDGELLSSADQKRYTKSYIDLMIAVPSREAILNRLQEKHTDEELIELLDPVAYTNGITRMKLWENSYYVERWSSDNIIRIKAIAQTKSMSRELLLACRDRLEAIAQSTPDTELVYEGEFYRKTSADAVAMSDEEQAAPAKKPSASRIILWLAAGLFIGILLSLILSVLFPVINRASDFGLYGAEPLGVLSKKTAPLFARVLDKMAGPDCGQIVLATGQKNSKKLAEVLPLLQEEFGKLGREVSLEGEENPEGKLLIRTAVSPDQDAAASDLCEQADLVILAEEKGKSRHSRFDETKHYLDLLGIEPKGAVLIA